MQLRLESRPVGDVLIIQCHGRIVAGTRSLRCTLKSVTPSTNMATSCCNSIRWSS